MPVIAQINEVEHIFAVSPTPEKLFFFFSKELGLPVVWDNKFKGKYASSAVWLGNVSLEFVGDSRITKTAFEGIALEPKQSARNILILLDSDRVSHDTVQSYSFTITAGNNPNEEVISWSAVSLVNALPNGIELFICDYEHRDRFILNRNIAADSLKNINGGPLGMMFLREIIVGCKNKSLCEDAMTKIPGIVKVENDLFSFSKGPSIRLINSDIPGIIKIVARVRSVTTARQYLQSKNLLQKSSKDGVYVDPSAIDGLIVELVEK